MKYDKIMAGENLENIMDRMKGLRALLYLLYESAGVSAITANSRPVTGRITARR